MILPDYKLVGGPHKFRNGHGRKSASFMQRYRLLAEPSRKVRSVSLQTTDLTVARRRAVKFVEDRLRKDLLARDPEARTASNGIAAALREYIEDSAATGNSPKQIAMVKMRIERVVKQAKLTEYAQVDCVVVTRAIAKLATTHKFGVVTKNRYREAMRAWSRWMKRNGRWPTHMLDDMPRFKGDDTPTRKRAIPTDAEFETVLAATVIGPDRRNLTGAQRYWLYLTASQTGLRAAELHSLKPSSFDLTIDPPTVTVACTVSKRRKTDTILLSRDFARLLQTWFADLDPDRLLWGSSWHTKAASMLRADLTATGIKAERDDGSVIDFHSFRALRVTRAILTGRSSRTVMQAVRLSSESLLQRYTRIPQSEVEELANAIPMPKLPLRVVG